MKEKQQGLERKKKPKRTGNNKASYSEKSVLNNFAVV